MKSRKTRKIIHWIEEFLQKKITIKSILLLALIIIIIIILITIFIGNFGFTFEFKSNIVDFANNNQGLWAFWLSVVSTFIALYTVLSLNRNNKEMQKQVKNSTTTIENTYFTILDTEINKMPLEFDATLFWFKDKRKFNTYIILPYKIKNLTNEIATEINISIKSTLYDDEYKDSAPFVIGLSEIVPKGLYIETGEYDIEYFKEKYFFAWPVMEDTLNYLTEKSRQPELKKLELFSLEEAAINEIEGHLVEITIKYKDYLRNNYVLKVKYIFLSQEAKEISKSSKAIIYNDITRIFLKKYFFELEKNQENIIPNSYPPVEKEYEIAKSWGVDNK